MAMKRSILFFQAAIALSVLGAFAPAGAQESPNSTGLRVPDSWVSVGAGHATGDERDRTLWGQYNGLREHDNNLLLDANVVKRNDATGFWTTFRGRDLGLETPELGFTVQQQGNWRFNADLTQIVHHEIRTINTGMLNAGSTNPTVVVIAPALGADENFEMKRTAIGLSGDKWFRPGLQFEVAFRNEDKDGTRLWGRGYDCASYVCTGTQNATNTRWAVLMIPEPVSFNTKQIDARVNFSGEKYLVSAGYYGSFFTNTNGNVTPSVPNPQLYGPLGPAGGLRTLNPAAAGGTSLQDVLQLPMALYPDNQAHQFYVSGNYAWTQKTRSTFKIAYTHATQNENYGSMGFTGAPTVLREDLGGVLDTTLMQFGITTRPTTRTSLLGNIRYERRDDKTPIDLYNVENTVRWDNSHISNKKLNAKVEGGYRFQNNVRATVGVDWDRISRELPGLDVNVAGLSGLRSQTDEVTLRGELRKSLSETLTGSIGASHAKRGGSDWYAVANNSPNPDLVKGDLYSYSDIYNRTATFPYNLADRTRDAFKATADWQATERLSLQLVAQTAHDGYDPPSQNGLRQGGMKLISLDGAYTISDNWKLTAYGSISDQTMNEADRANYVANTKNRNIAYGLNLIGRPTGVLEVGGGITRVQDITDYSLTPDFATTANNVTQNTVGLPDVKFSDTRYGVWSKYAFSKQADVRLDITRISTRLEEWAWGYNGVPWVYSDGTTVSLQPHQQVTFTSARFIYKF
jgi:MtrB/PioB family decaheme-associated outer membrane protein